MFQVPEVQCNKQVYKLKRIWKNVGRNRSAVGKCTHNLIDQLISARTRVNINTLSGPQLPIKHWLAAYGSGSVITISFPKSRY